MKKKKINKLNKIDGSIFLSLEFPLPKANATQNSHKFWIANTFVASWCANSITVARVTTNCTCSDEKCVECFDDMSQSYVNGKYLLIKLSTLFGWTPGEWTLCWIGILWPLDRYRWWLAHMDLVEALTMMGRMGRTQAGAHTPLVLDTNQPVLDTPMDPVVLAYLAVVHMDFYLIRNNKSIVISQLMNL